MNVVVAVSCFLLLLRYLSYKKYCLWTSFATQMLLSGPCFLLLLASSYLGLLCLSIAGVLWGAELYYRSARIIVMCSIHCNCCGKKYPRLTSHFSLRNGMLEHVVHHIKEGGLVGKRAGRSTSRQPDSRSIMNVGVGLGRSRGRSVLRCL